ncbi:metal-dependent transcriptional regulator [Planctomycetota bacterium]
MQTNKFSKTMCGKIYDALNHFCHRAPKRDKIPSHKPEERKSEFPFFSEKSKKCLTKLAKPNYISCHVKVRKKIPMATAQKLNLSSSLEDYLEAIFNLSSESNIARSKDIAKILGVSRSSVTGALRVLKKKGLANYKPYDYVTLTESGQTAAAQIVRKHNILKAFFINILGIEPDLAQQAACKAEHALGPEIIARLLCFIDFVTQSGKNGFNLSDEFQKFCENESKRLKKS